MSARRVVFVCSSTSWGGTEKWALRAAEGIAAAGRQVTFVARKPDMFRERMKLPLPIVRLPFRNDTDFWTVLRLAELFRRRADVVVLTRVRDYWLGGLAARMALKPILLRLGVVRRMRDLHPMDFLRYGLLPSKILVNARAIRETLLETNWIDPDEVHVIYNGVDTPGPLTAEQRQSLRREWGVADNEFLLVGAGRFAVEKRWSWMVEATARLLADGIPVRAVLLGEGDERPALEALVRKHRLEGRFRMPGMQTSIAPTFGAADTVTLPSSNEGISNTMLEALGLGAPVVATLSGGVQEHFEDERDLMLVDTNDFPAYLERLRLLASDPERRAELGRAGLERVRDAFSWDRMSSSLIALIDIMTEVKR